MKINVLKPVIGIVAASLLILGLGVNSVSAAGVRTPQLASEVDREEPMTPEQIQAQYENLMQQCSVLLGKERLVCEEEAKDKRTIAEDNAHIDRKDSEKRKKEPIQTRKTAH